MFIIPPLDVVTSGSGLLSVSKSVTGSMRTNVLNYCKNVHAQKQIYLACIFFDLNRSTIVFYSNNVSTSHQIIDKTFVIIFNHNMIFVKNVF